MKIVVCATEILVPPDRGSHRRAIGMSEALRDLGHDVHLLTWRLDGRLADQLELPVTILRTGPPKHNEKLSAFQRRYQRYYNATPERVGAIKAELDRREADVLIRMGPDGAAYLAGLPEVARLWYLGDELLLGYIGILTGSGKLPWSWRETVRGALLNATGERVLGREVDEVWTLTDRDAAWLRRVLGHSRTRVIANGVNLDYFQRPTDVAVKPARIVFWGRLDFRVNQTALKWFFDRVWPGLKAEVPEVEMLVVGFAPTDFVRSMCARPDVELVPGPEDLRGWVSTSRIAVQPFVSGAGIKNKLLEAASLGHAIVGTSRATLGLRRGSEDAWIESDSPQEWIRAIRRLIRDPDETKRLGEAARRWVLGHHTWEAAARLAEQGIEAALRRRDERRRSC